MLNHNSVEANTVADANQISDGKSRADAQTEIHAEEGQLFRTLFRKRDVAPVAYMPRALATNPKARGLRRILTREQGRALEIIGHAVDYLNDCYLFEGADDELINVGGCSSDAIQIMVAARWQILESAPVRESRGLRLWNALLHRHRSERPGVVFRRAGDAGSQGKSASVLPLSSSR
jgi:hypothetical protein